MQRFNQTWQHTLQTMFYWPVSGRCAVFVVWCLTLICISYVGWLAPKWQQLQSIAAQRQRWQQPLATSPALPALPVLQRQRRTWRQLRSELQRALRPATSHKPLDLATLATRAQHFGLVVGQLSWRHAHDQPRYLHIEGRGEFVAVVRWLTDLGQQPPLVELSNLTLTAAPHQQVSFSANGQYFATRHAQALANLQQGEL